MKGTHGVTAKEGQLANTGSANISGNECAREILRAKDHKPENSGYVKHQRKAGQKAGLPRFGSK